MPKRGKSVPAALVLPHGGRAPAPGCRSRGGTSMRQLVVVSMIALSACSSGCAILCDATSLMVFKVRESIKDCHENVRNHKWAEEAWVQVRACTPGAPYSKDYGQGFKDGYTYFLFHGGNGEPP